MYIPTIYSIPFSANDYYIVMLDKTGLDALVMNDVFPVCTSSGNYEWCYVFKDLNWAVMKLKTTVPTDLSNTV